MDFQGLSAIVFVILVLLFLWWKRKDVKVQGIFPLFYFVMYRTKFGLRFMDRMAKRFPKSLKWLSTAGIWIGFAGMVAICALLIQATLKLLTKPEAAPEVQLVLPIEAKGVFFVPFLYWIISIFVIAVVHEFAHGIVARLYNIKVKSAGFAFLGILLPIIPAAFVEPDEKASAKKPKKAQLAVFAAGPFSNILLAGVIFLLLFFVGQPLAESVYEQQGVKIVEVVEGSPASIAGLNVNEIVEVVDGRVITSTDNFTAILAEKKPGDTLALETRNGTYEILLEENPDNVTRPYVGVKSRQHVENKEEFEAKYGKIIPEVILWFFGLFYWLYLLNIGIGLFNLVPMGPLDGGRMLRAVLEKRKNGKSLFALISLFFLLLILLNLFAGFFI